MGKVTKISVIDETRTFIDRPLHTDISFTSDDGYHDDSSLFQQTLDGEKERLEAEAFAKKMELEKLKKISQVDQLEELKQTKVTLEAIQAYKKTMEMAKYKRLK